jgi:DNA-binding CsgD family transcriptional regulator
VASPVVLAVLSVAAERTAGQSGVPVLLSCARPEIARAVSVLHPSGQVYSSHRPGRQPATTSISHRAHERRPWPANRRSIPRPIVPGGSVATVALSDCETEMLRHLATTCTLAEIATAMNVSVNTAKAHLRSIYRKLEVSRRRDAVRRASERGLLT